MRVIEKNIISTIKTFDDLGTSKNMTKALSCRDVVHSVNRKAQARLWENPIFAMDFGNKSVVWFSFAGWSSNTTKSRLNALLSAFSMGGFFQKDLEIYYTSSNQKAVKIDASNIYKIVDGQVSEVSDFWEFN
jgi:hypothetical protein